VIACINSRKEAKAALERADTEEPGK